VEPAHPYFFLTRNRSDEGIDAVKGVKPKKEMNRARSGRATESPNVGGIATKGPIWSPGKEPGGEKGKKTE